jgi:tRNA pseudouridine synthase 9
LTKAQNFHGCLDLMEMVKPERYTSSTLWTQYLRSAASDAGNYQIHEGLRRVAPYFFVYNTFCKERWRERKLLDIFESEFREKTIEYYTNAIKQGTVLVNEKKVPIDYIVKNGDLISHLTHRHEPPVSAESIDIIHEDADMIVINKPSGIPVHPAGRYKYNSILEIMKYNRGITNGILYPCNRLDRLTSGLMFIAKSAPAAESMCKQIMHRTVRKEYIARVIGLFPDGEVVCDQPILQIAPKVGLNRVRATGKSARTVFKRLAYYMTPNTYGTRRDETAESSIVTVGQETACDSSNGLKGYSIVRAMPVTGRTHQIRVHLQHLGHPIENDPIYANRKVWGYDLGFNDPEGTLTTDKDVIDRLSRMGKDEIADAVAYHDEMVDAYHKQTAEKMSGEVCDTCETPLYTDPGDQELSLWLHSLRYEDVGGKWLYKSPLPAWALPPSGFHGPTEVEDMADLIVADFEA